MRESREKAGRAGYGQAEERWLKLFGEWSDSVERLLLRTVIGLALLLLAAQAALQLPVLRTHLVSVEREMGQQIIGTNWDMTEGERHH